MANPTGSGRRASLDWMRGLVMVFMAIDHASMFYNAGRTSADSALLYVPGSELPLDQFLTRWITHLCAPTFLFLAGTAMALSIARRVERGQSDAEIDRFLVTRGLILIAIEFVMTPPGLTRLVVQVMYALGAAMICMALLRRLPAIWLAIAGVVWLGGGEAISGLVWAPDESGSVGVALLVGQHVSEHALIIYPLLPWLAMMMVGWAFGQLLMKRPDLMRVVLVVAGVGALAVFAIVRGLDGYGNMGVYRDDGSLAQWLHVGKYPPSLSFAALELGLMALLLVAFDVAERHVTVRHNGPLLVFGQTALFFYVVHHVLLMAPAIAGGLLGRLGLAESYLIALGVLIALYPVCRWYRSYKRAHPNSWARFI